MKYLLGVRKANKMQNESIKKLNKSIENITKHNYFRMHSSLKIMLLTSLLKGLVSGLGWVLGATILVSFLTFTLSQIEFIPIFGEWVSQLIKEIETFER